MLKDEQGIFSYSFNGKLGIYTTISRCPSAYTHELITVTTNSQRSVGQGAYLNAEYLATKNKFNFTWNYEDSDQYAELAKFKYQRSFFFWIKIVDPESPENGLKQFNVYCSDLKSSAVRAEVEDGKIVAWKEVTMSLIER